MAKLAGLHDPGAFDFEGSSIAYCVVAFCIALGALLGTSSVTVYIESATGISGTRPSTRNLQYNALRIVCRGWQDRIDRHYHWNHVLHFNLLRPHFFVISTVGYGGCIGDRWFSDDSQVSPSSVRCQKRTKPFSVLEINWHYIGDAVPAFITLLMIPLTFK
jgi:AGZA family xanthine/uracil permease-like MFS transporter